jgi:hypothetical protein
MSDSDDDLPITEFIKKRRRLKDTFQGQQVTAMTVTEQPTNNVVSDGNADSVSGQIAEEIIIDNQIVFRDASTIFVYCVRRNQWFANTDEDQIRTVSSLVVDGASAYAQFSATLSATNNLQRSEKLLATAQLMRCIGKLNVGQTSVFIVLVPTLSQTVPGTPAVRVLFCRCSKLSLNKVGSTSQKRRYNKFLRKPLDKQGTMFFGLMTLFLYCKQETVLRFAAETAKQYCNTEERQRIWHVLTNAQHCDEYERFAKHVPGQVVYLPDQAAARLKQQVKQELPERVNYKGGHFHAPLRLFRKTEHVPATLAAKYITPPVPQSDYHLSQSQNPPIFSTTHSAPDIVNAVAGVRELAKSKMLTDSETNDVLGALSSVLYEDIAWNMTPNPPQVSNAQLQYLSIDIDQVLFSCSRNVYTVVLTLFLFTRHHR